mgnify:CR=1 FL=1
MFFYKIPYAKDESLLADLASQPRFHLFSKP